MLRPGVDPHEISQMVMIQSIGLNFMSTMIDQIDKVSSQKLILAFSAALGKSIDQR